MCFLMLEKNATNLFDFWIAVLCCFVEDSAARILLMLLMMKDIKWQRNATHHSGSGSGLGLGLVEKGMRMK